MDNNSNDFFSDDEHFWMRNEEDETIVLEQNEELAQSDTSKSDDKSAGEATPRKKSRKILYKEEAKFDNEQSLEEWLREEKQLNWTWLYEHFWMGNEEDTRKNSIKSQIMFFKNHNFLVE